MGRPAKQLALSSRLLRRPGRRNKRRASVPASEAARLALLYRRYLRPVIPAPAASPEDSYSLEQPWPFPAAPTITTTTTPWPAPAR